MALTASSNPMNTDHPPYGRDLKMSPSLRTGAITSNRITRTVNLLQTIPGIPPNSIYLPGNQFWFTLPVTPEGTILKNISPIIRLAFNFVCTDQCYPVKNLARSLISQLEIDVGSGNFQQASVIQGYDRLMTFQDLYMTPQQRSDAERQGIQSINMAKARQNAGSTSISATNGATLTAATTPAYTQMAYTFTGTGANTVPATALTQYETALATLYKNQYILPLDLDFLCKNGNLYTRGYEDQFFVRITLNAADKVLLTDLNNTVASTTNIASMASVTYQISNLQLEYETFADDALAREDMFRNVMFFHDISIPNGYQNYIIPNSQTTTTIQITNPKNRVEGILGILEYVYTPIATGGTPGINSLQYNTECYPVGGITSITNISFNGIPLILYPNPLGLQLIYMYDEINRWMSPEDLKDYKYYNQTNDQYYGGNQFAFFIDTRQTQDNRLEGSGIKVDSNNTITFNLNRTPLTTLPPSTTGTGNAASTTAPTNLRLTIWQINQGQMIFNRGCLINRVQ